MRRLRTFHFSEGHQARLLKGILEERGIPCVLRNERLSAGMGEIPFVECFPELWVIEDEDFAAARSIAEDWQQPLPAATEAWVCRQCGETVEGNLGECWRCGRASDH